jgi:ferredoxin
MAAKLMRKIVTIDEAKCTGCGSCALKCAEGALKIIEGKARLISDTYCDGLGACLGECPQGAITIEERPADEFSESSVEQHLRADRNSCPGTTVQVLASSDGISSCGCSGYMVQEIAAVGSESPASPGVSQLTHWPVQLTLVPPTAPFLKNANIVLTADCVPCAYPNFHEDVLTGRVLLLACPKLDDYTAQQNKLTQIMLTAKPVNLSVVHMEVPCCSGLVYMAKQAIKESKINIPLHEVTISIGGEIKKEAIKQTT